MKASLMAASFLASVLLLLAAATAVGANGAVEPPSATIAAQPAAAQPAASQPATPPPVASQPASPQPASPQHADAPPNMATYYVALLRRGPNWTPTLTPEISKALDGHMANIRRLAAEGKLVLAGPFLEQSGPGTLAGLFVLQAGSIAEAKQLVATDPAVQAGRFVPEILPWLGPKSLQTLITGPSNR